MVYCQLHVSLNDQLILFSILIIYGDVQTFININVLNVLHRFNDISLNFSPEAINSIGYFSLTP